MAELTKKEASIKALKDSNRHLTELFNGISSCNVSIYQAITILEAIKRASGGMQIEVYENQSKKIVLLANVAQQAIDVLNQGKINA